MRQNNYITPEYATPEDIKRKRKELGMTQREFAELIGASKPTVERWEKSDNRITGPVVLLLQMLTKEYVQRIRIPERELPVRMWYMYQNQKCTMIDVDESRQMVQIKNFTNLIQFRAFGVNEMPTFQEYKDFLESRCFPESRDKMKLILEDLDLPFYDPLMIIEKTQGRMAEDDFWIDVE